MDHKRLTIMFPVLLCDILTVHNFYFLHFRNLPAKLHGRLNTGKTHQNTAGKIHGGVILDSGLICDTEKLSLHIERENLYMHPELPHRDFFLIMVGKNVSKSIRQLYETVSDLPGRTQILNEAAQVHVH